MKRIPVFVGLLVISALFIMCPKSESPPAEGGLQVQIQGHVYDNQTKQPIADNYVGLYQQIQANNGLPTLAEVGHTKTDNGGFYSIQGTVASGSCKVGTSRLYLMPPSGIDTTGTSIGCTAALQTIDLYK